MSGLCCPAFAKIHSLSLLAAIVVHTLAPTACRAQPKPFDLDEALTSLRAAYTSGVVEEEVEVIVKRGSSSWRDQFILRLNPGTRADHADAACLLELGELRVWWTDRKIIAVHDRNAASCLVLQAGVHPDVQEFARILRPVPVPQFSLAFDGPAGAGHTLLWPTPYTPSISWTAATRDERRTPNDVTLTGTSEALSPASLEPGSPQSGKASLVMDARTGRLKKFVAEIDGGKMEIELRIRPEAAVPLAEWAVSTEGRSRASKLSDIVPVKGDALLAGSVPDMLFQDADSKMWDWFAPFTPRTSNEPAPEFVALLFIRETALIAPDEKHEGAPPAPAAEVFANADADAALTLLKKLRDEIAKNPDAKRDVVGARGIAIQIVLIAERADGNTRDKVARGVSKWGADAIWSASPASTIERVAPQSRTAVVIAKRDRSLCAVVHLDGHAATLPALEAQIRDALRCEKPKSETPTPEK